MKTAGIGEDNLIRRLKRLVPGRADVVTGIGDDCAVVRTGRHDPFDLLLKSDPVIEGVHFTADAPAMDVGHKALGRVLSDIAAMGGEPLWVLVDLVVPVAPALCRREKTRRSRICGSVATEEIIPVARIEGLYRGLAKLARRYGVALVGGDTSRGKTLELHVFAVGRVARGRAVLRSGAKAGDVLYVTGMLGGSGQGRHLRFEPRVTEGQWLAAQGWATAMMDISDGLATDLRRMMAASGTGALLEAERIPIAASARHRRGRRSPLEHALADGEDFELLFTVSRRKAVEFEAAWRRAFRLRCTRVGTMTKALGKLELEDHGVRRELELRGYEHFC